MKRHGVQEMEAYTEIEVSLRIKFDATAGMKGSRDRYGVPQEPDSPAEVDITGLEFEKCVFVKGSPEYSYVSIPDLLEAEIAEMYKEALEEACWESIKK